MLREKHRRRIDFFLGYFPVICYPKKRILSQLMETVQWQGLGVTAGRTSFAKELSIILVEGGPPHWYLRLGRLSFSSFSSLWLVEWVERAPEGVNSVNSVYWCSPRDSR